MAGQIIISNIKTDSDNAFSILANTGAVLFSANLASGITTGIADGSVTNAKLAGSITGDKIATGQITGNLIATGQITGNLLTANCVSGNNIVSSPTITGNVTINGSLGIGGATTPSSGVGIKFPGTQVASTDANTLDDYEEGSFTPVVVGVSTPGTGTYGAQVGNYTKIGRQVFFQIYIQVSNHTGTGEMFISGLPFTVSSISSSSAYTALATWTNNLALTAGNILQSYPDPAGTTITLNQVPTGGGAVSSIQIDTAFQIMLAGNYFS